MRVRLDLPRIYDYENAIIDEGFQQVVLEHISYCHKCAGCKPGKNMTIFGRDLKDICITQILYFHDPDATAVSYIKRLLELEKQARKTIAVK